MIDLFTNISSDFTTQLEPAAGDSEMVDTDNIPSNNAINDTYEINDELLMYDIIYKYKLFPIISHDKLKI